MTEIQLIDHAALPEPDRYLAPLCQVRGRSRSRLATPVGYRQWLVTGRLEGATEIRWPGDHGDEAVYLRAGRLEVDGAICQAGGAVVLEAGAHPVVRALEESVVIHVGGQDQPSATGSGSVHLLGPQGMEAGNPMPGVTWFADATCETCRIMFFLPHGASGFTSRSHSHSEDELIHVLAGEVQLGRHRAGPGTTVAIPGDRRYRLHFGEAYAFLNYRRGPSYMTADPKEPPIREGMAARV